MCWLPAGGLANEVVPLERMVAATNRGHAATTAEMPKPTRKRDMGSPRAKGASNSGRCAREESCACDEDPYQRTNLGRVSA